MELLQSPIPLYYQLKHSIKQRIVNEEWGSGTAIPSERELGKMFHLSRTTIRQAIGELVVEGVLEKKHGKGTFVAERSITRTTTTLVGLVEQLQLQQLEPRIQLHEYGIIPAPPKVSKAMRIFEGADMIKVQRQIRVQEQCAIVDDNYFNMNLASYLTEENVVKPTVYDLLEKNGIQVKRGSQSFTAVALDSTYASYFDLPPGSPALVVHTVLFNNRDMPLQYSISYCNPEVYSHDILLTR
ncbi:GntR family transcriptional regulator [Paenibacillus sp. ACRRX]|uniref:GntR family transcriptional regulator n=1 Tax=Paenibacillus sp. ACRRX TaxID=2918206 RepID=UPI001EF6DF30|nr:GntR family transcriptional regulator [Paenibacillus sp. ACRRX]MCG7408699.1 GntR family transcriptional regulator [Paenibacillus sp. ACRRX]